MLKMNTPRLGLPYPRTANDIVISFSHFLPRSELPYPSHVTEMAKNVGCLELNLQLDQLQPRVHVYGHTHIDADMELGSGATRRRYVQRHLDPGKPSLLCIWDGQTLCSKDA